MSSISEKSRSLESNQTKHRHFSISFSSRLGRLFLFNCVVGVSLFTIWTHSSTTDLHIPNARTVTGQLTTLYPYKHDLKFLCNVSIHQGMDLMQMKPQSFIKRFKNPCWYKNTELRCLPYMYLVGQAKCGTTDLFYRITRHPDFVKPTTKETNWFTVRRFFNKQTFSYYTSKFFSPLVKALSTSNYTNLITGDGSTSTLGGAVFWNYLGINVGHDEPLENNADYIHHLFRGSKILINVRNPVDRLWSEYLAFSRSKVRSASIFHEIVQREIHIFNECLRSRTLRACSYDNTLSIYASLSKSERKSFSHRCIKSPTDIVKIRRGLYHVFIRDFLKVFPRENILIQRLEDISKDRNGSLLRTFEFLGLEKLPEASMQKILERKVLNPRTSSSRRKGEMFNSTRQLLYRFYKPHNEALAILLDNIDFNYGPMGG